jgi:hypothetical protein
MRRPIRVAAEAEDTEIVRPHSGLRVLASLIAENLRGGAPSQAVTAHPAMPGARYKPRHTLSCTMIRSRSCK